MFVHCSNDFIKFSLCWWWNVNGRWWTVLIDRRWCHRNIRKSKLPPPTSKNGLSSDDEFGGHISGLCLTAPMRININSIRSIILVAISHRVSFAHNDHWCDPNNNNSWLVPCETLVLVLLAIKGHAYEYILVHFGNDDDSNYQTYKCSLMCNVVWLYIDEARRIDKCCPCRYASYR